MKMTFDYYYETTAADTIDVEDIGNCWIAANNMEGHQYFLLIKTVHGVTRTYEYGPYVDAGFPTTVNATFSQFDYSDNKLQKIIYKFLNDKSKRIVQAQEVLESASVEGKLINPLRYYKDEF